MTATTVLKQALAKGNSSRSSLDIGPGQPLPYDRHKPRCGLEGAHLRTAKARQDRQQSRAAPGID
ncbi:hypothetical protein YIM73518_00690 [Thermus brockianus]|uniref:Uncharacterized protein n=1 Tax=Thermus brockianus TaxID=56956 RepID=A0ABM7XIM0_THEBO|nr:hypothetical protein TbrSNM41_08720 [Thermus brockianus]